MPNASGTLLERCCLVEHIRTEQRNSYFDRHPRSIGRARRQPAREADNGSQVDYLESRPALKVGGLLLEKYDDTTYGYLRVDATKKQLKIGFHEVGSRSLAQSRYDMVTVDLASHTMVSN